MKRRTGLACLVPILVLAGLLTATPAAASANDCRSSAYACTPGYTGSNASGSWAWKYYGGSWASTSTGSHNCTLYVAWRLAQNGLPDPGRSWGNAVDWPRALGGGDRRPAVGAVAWWGATVTNPHGHVAYVEQVSGDKVYIRADNWSSSGGYTNAGWVSAASVGLFLHPRDLAPPSPGGSPVGNLEVVSQNSTGVRFRGWAADPDTSAPIAVHAYVTSQHGAATTADRQRPDVGAHAFDVTRGGIVAGTYNVCAYGINVAGTPGANALLGCRSFTVT